MKGHCQRISEKRGFTDFAPIGLEVVPLILKPSRSFSFIPAKKYPFIAVGAVELWAARSAVQASVVNGTLSIDAANPSAHPQKT